MAADLYNSDYVHNEAGYDNGNDWSRIPDRRVSYESADYPWIVAAYRYHNKVNSTHHIFVNATRVPAPDSGPWASGLVVLC